MAAVFAKPADLLQAEGRDLGHTDWEAIDQRRIDLFAEATGDHQWIHVDPKRAAEGPFGACIAHGYLTLSLVNLFLPQLIQVQQMSAGVNVGLDRVRFPQPVLVDSRLRGHGLLVSALERKGGVQALIRVTLELEGEDRPAAVADTLSLYFP